MNTDRLKAGVSQATAASALFKADPLDVVAFQDGLTKAEEAINTLKIASGMVVNYPTSQQAPYNIKQMEPESLAATMKSGRIELGEGEEEPIIANQPPSSAVAPGTSSMEKLMEMKMPGGGTFRNLSQSLAVSKGVQRKGSQLAQNILKGNIYQQKVRNIYQQQANIEESKARQAARLPLLLKQGGGRRRTAHRNQKRRRTLTRKQTRRI